MKLVVTRDERGFTLVEVLVAFVFFAVVLTALLDSLAIANRSNADTGRYYTAMFLAQSKMEEIKNNDFTQVQNVTPACFHAESDGDGSAGFLYAVAVNNSSACQKTVVVTVYYYEAGVPREVAFTGEMARR